MAGVCVVEMISAVRPSTLALAAHLDHFMVSQLIHKSLLLTVTVPQLGSCIMCMVGQGRTGLAVQLFMHLDIIAMIHCIGLPASGKYIT